MNKHDEFPNRIWWCKQPTNQLITNPCGLSRPIKGMDNYRKTYIILNSHKFCHTFLFIYGRNPTPPWHLGPQLLHHRQQLLRLLPRATRRRHGMLREVQGARFSHQQRQQGLHSHVGAKDQVLGMEWENWWNGKNGPRNDGNMMKKKTAGTTGGWGIVFD